MIPRSLYELKNCIAGGEGLRLEFKQVLPEPRKLVREAVALANTSGGLLLVGITDDGQITGVTDPDEVAEVFRNAIATWSRPMLKWEIIMIPVSNKRAVIALSIPASEERPHYLRDEPQSAGGTVLIRVDDKSVTATREVVQLMKLRHRSHDLRVEYGEKENILMKLIGEKGSVTLQEFREAAKLNREQASRTLIHLVRARILRILPGEGEDRYFTVQEN